MSRSGPGGPRSASDRTTCETGHGSACAGRITKLSGRDAGAGCDIRRQASSSAANPGAMPRTSIGTTIRTSGASAAIPPDATTANASGAAATMNAAAAPLSKRIGPGLTSSTVQSQRDGRSIVPTAESCSGADDRRRPCGHSRDPGGRRVCASPACAPVAADPRAGTTAGHRSARASRGTRPTARQVLRRPPVAPPCELRPSGLQSDRRGPCRARAALRVRCRLEVRRFQQEGGAP